MPIAAYATGPGGTLSGDYVNDIDNSDSKLRVALNVYRQTINKSKFYVRLDFIWKNRPVYAFTDAIALSSSASLNPISKTQKSEYLVHSSIKNAAGQIVDYKTDKYTNKVTTDKEGVLAKVDIRKYGDFYAGHEGYIESYYQFNNPEAFSTGSIYGEYIHATLKYNFSIEDGKIKPGLPDPASTRITMDVSVHNGNKPL